MNLHKDDYAFEAMLADHPQLSVMKIECYFKDRGSGQFRCSSCFSLVWHSDAIGHALWHARNRSVLYGVSYDEEESMEPEDKQYVVVIEYCNGRYRAPQRMLLGADYIKATREG